MFISYYYCHPTMCSVVLKKTNKEQKVKNSPEQKRGSIIRQIITDVNIVGGMIREKHSIWYGTLAVWYDGTVSWIYDMTIHRMWYGIVGGMVREKHSMYVV